MDKKTKPVCPKATEKFRGVDVDIADSDKVDPKMVKDDVKELNNNPRNDDM